MKTLITTFAIAVMAVAFTTGSVMATEQSNKKVKKGFDEFGDIMEGAGEYIKCNLKGDAKHSSECADDFNNLDVFGEKESDEGDREVADSGEEGSTSAASASDQ